MNFVDWTHISNKFTESIVKAIRRVQTKLGAIKQGTKL